MSEIKVEETVANLHYNALVNANENIKDKKSIALDYQTNITVNSKLKNAYEYSARLELYIEECIDKDASALSRLNQAFLKTDEQAKNSINKLMEGYK